MDILQLLIWPSLACLVLTGIHVYLGLHIVARGVIFVDLSLAQVAALGTTVAFLAGFQLHTPASYLFSLTFALLGAAAFSFARRWESKVPQEAIIGIVYAVSSALAILIMDRSPEGSEHVKYILVGNLIGVSRPEVLKMAALYSAVGVLHWLWRDPFFLISNKPKEAEASGMRVRWWDFLFYATFGAVVTSSVEIAGVLLVFSYLIIPAVFSMLFFERTRARLASGWALGTAVSVAAMAASYHYDTPTGATIICVFGAALALAGLLSLLLERPKVS